MAVSFLPFPTRLLAEAIHTTDAERIAVILYGAWLVVIAALFGLMVRAITRNPSLLRPEAEPEGDPRDPEAHHAEHRLLRSRDRAGVQSPPRRGVSVPGHRDLRPREREGGGTRDGGGRPGRGESPWVKSSAPPDRLGSGVLAHPGGRGSTDWPTRGGSATRPRAPFGPVPTCRLLRRPEVEAEDAAATGTGALSARNGGNSGHRRTCSERLSARDRGFASHVTLEGCRPLRTSVPASRT